MDGLVAIVVGLLLVVGGILGVIAVIAVIAVAGVAGTMALGVLEQTPRDRRAPHHRRVQPGHVRRLLLLQGLTVAALGCVLGVALSLPVAALLGGAIADKLIAASLPFGFSWLAVAAWVVVALLIGAFGATRPVRVAARLTIRDTLAYE